MPAFKYTFRNLSIWSFIIILICGGCKQSNSSDPYPYTPNDFDEPLRDLLKKIEQHNIVYLFNAGCRGGGEIYDAAQIYVDELQELASQKDLLKAAKCSSPVIRGYILQLLMETTMDAVPLIQEHLYDTAIVFDDYSNQKWTIISLLLLNTFHWESTADRKSIEKEVLEKQPFERAAYTLINEERHIDTFPGFYAIIRKMARNLMELNSYSINNWYTGQGAMERLASYRYQQDIPLLDSLFDRSLYDANGHFFPGKSIIIFPAPAFDKYYLDTSIGWHRHFYFLRSRNSNNYYDNSEDGIYYFVNLVIQHKSEKSARLLEKILYQSPFEFNGVGRRGIYHLQLEKENLKSYIAEGIRVHKNPHYEKLINDTEKYMNQKHGEPGFYARAYREIEQSSPPKKQPDVKPFRAYWWQ